MLGEVARVLRPGGLFLSGEWERGPTFASPVTGNPSTISATYHLLNIVDNALRAKHPGVFPIASHIPSWLAESGRFRNITAQLHAVPIGDWHPDPEMKELGNTFRDMLVRYANNLKPMLRDPELGLGEAQINNLVTGYMNDMYGVSGMIGVYRTVHAKKL